MHKRYLTTDIVLSAVKAVSLFFFLFNQYFNWFIGYTFNLSLLGFALLAVFAFLNGHKLDNLSFRRALFCLATFFVWMLFSFVISRSGEYANIKIQKIFLVFTGFAIVPYAFNRSLDYKLFKYLIILAAIFYAGGILYLNELGAISFVRDSKGFFEKAPDYLGLSYILVFGIILLVDSFNILKGFLLLAILAAMLLLGARGPVIFLLLTFLMRFIFDFRRYLKTISLFYAFSGIMIIGYYVSTSNFTEILESRFEAALTNRQNSSLQGREFDYEYALTSLESSPIIGDGIGSFGVVHYGIDGKRHPHNLFLEISAETGLIGLLIFCVFIVTFVFSLTIGGQNSNIFKAYKLEILSLLVFVFLESLKSSGLDEHRALFCFAGLMYTKFE
tara:strand:- start:1068 stop:2231 length:1164 start_codon:yes stop_codon:yes gene_type:complete